MGGLVCAGRQAPFIWPPAGVPTHFLWAGGGAALRSAWPALRRALEAALCPLRGRCYGPVLKMLADEQGDWYVEKVLSHELGRVLTHGTRDLDSSPPASSPPASSPPSSSPPTTSSPPTSSPPTPAPSVFGSEAASEALDAGATFFAPAPRYWRGKPRPRPRPRPKGRPRWLAGFFVSPGP